MTLLQLKYIVKIVECGSMNEASHALYVSQPALSTSDKEKQTALAIEVFTRSSQGIALALDSCARSPPSTTCSPSRRSWR